MVCSVVQLLFPSLRVCSCRHWLCLEDRDGERELAHPPGTGMITVLWNSCSPACHYHGILLLQILSCVSRRRRRKESCQTVKLSSYKTSCWKYPLAKCKES